MIICTNPADVMTLCQLCGVPCLVLQHRGLVCDVVPSCDDTMVMALVALQHCLYGGKRGMCVSFEMGEGQLTLF